MLYRIVQFVVNLLYNMLWCIECVLTAFFWNFQGQTSEMEWEENAMNSEVSSSDSSNCESPASDTVDDDQEESRSGDLHFNHHLHNVTTLGYVFFILCLSTLSHGISGQSVVWGNWKKNLEPNFFPICFQSLRSVKQKKNRKFSFLILGQQSMG